MTWDNVSIYMYCDLYIVDGGEIFVKTSFMSSCKCPTNLVSCLEQD